MEDLSHDPEFAQEFVKLLGARLKQAKRALEEARTENDELKAKLRQTNMRDGEIQAHSQFLLDPNDVVGELEETKAMLEERTRKLQVCTEENTRLHSEVNRLHLALRVLAGSSANGGDGSQLSADINSSGSFSDTSTVASEPLSALHGDNFGEDAKQMGKQADNAHALDAETRERQRTACIGPGRNPITIPKTVKKFSHEKASILYWPGRTAFPYGDPSGTDARIRACLSKCDTSTDPFSWSPAGHNLGQLEGSTRELFHNIEGNGVCYLGAFYCVKTGKYTPEEFDQLDAHEKEDVVMQSFARPAQYRSSSLSDKNIVRGMYSSGKVQVEYVHLQFKSFNRDFFEALAKQKEDDALADLERREKRKQEEDNGGKVKKLRTLSASAIDILDWL